MLLRRLSLTAPLTHRTLRHLKAAVEKAVKKVGHKAVKSSPKIIT